MSGSHPCLEQQTHPKSHQSQECADLSQLPPIKPESLVKKPLVPVAEVTCPTAEHSAGKEHCRCWDLTSDPTMGCVYNPARSLYGPSAGDFKPGMPWSMAAFQVDVPELIFTPLLLHSAEH